MVLTPTTDGRAFWAMALMVSEYPSLTSISGISGRFFASSIPACISVIFSSSKRSFLLLSLELLFNASIPSSIPDKRTSYSSSIVTVPDFASASISSPMLSSLAVKKIPDATSPITDPIIVPTSNIAIPAIQYFVLFFFSSVIPLTFHINQVSTFMIMIPLICKDSLINI